MKLKLSPKILLALRWIAALILVQTLFFKFTGAPESKFIFTTLGMEPWGRWLSGVAELIASVLLVLPATQAVGALLALGVMSGAILSHIFVLGISVRDDGGLLFGMACIVFLICAVVVITQRAQLMSSIRKTVQKVIRLKETRGSAK